MPSAISASRAQCVDPAAKDRRPAVANVSVWAMGNKAAMIASAVHVRDKLTYCVVEVKKCQTAQEWEAAAAPLMKE